jgi:hypothetical protein
MLISSPLLSPLASVRINGFRGKTFERVRDINGLHHIEQGKRESKGYKYVIIAIAGVVAHPSHMRTLFFSFPGVLCRYEVQEHKLCRKIKCFATSSQV